MKFFRKHSFEISILFFLMCSIHSCSHAKDIKVMVIDTGVFVHRDISPYVSGGTLEDWQDSYGHGTHVAGIIVKDTCKAVKLISCKFSDGRDGDGNLYLGCLQKALKEKVDIINFSGGGIGPYKEEYELFKQLNDKGIIIITSAGNRNKNLGSPCFGFFPACYFLNNMVIVGNITSKHERQEDSDYGLPGMIWEVGTRVYSTTINNKYKYMTGTSMAAAVHTNRILKNLCKELQ